MPTLNSKSRLKANAAANKMVDKYGHACNIIISTDYATPIPASCLFTKNDLAFQNGSLIINNNFKILLKSVSLPAMLLPGSKVVVNGVELVALTVNKLTPDGVNTILWEIEAAGAVLPDDVVTITTPYITFPSNLQENVTHTGTGSTCSLTLTGSVPTGMADNDSFASADWQISIEADFATQVAVSTGNTANPVTWTTDAVLSEATVYFARVRYNTTNSKVSAWSNIIQFNLTEAQEVSIETPTVIVAAADLDPINAYGDYMGYAMTVRGSTPVITGDTFSHAVWQFYDNVYYTEAAPYTSPNQASATQEWVTIEEGRKMVQGYPGGVWYRVKYVTNTGVSSAYSGWRWSKPTLVEE